MRRFISLALVSAVLCFAGSSVVSPLYAQGPDARMQKVLAEFVQTTGNSVMGVGSWVKGAGFDAATSDFDMRLVLSQGGTEAQQLARWQQARNQLAKLIREEFGDQAGPILQRTNLYAPNQLMSGIENASDAMERFQRLKTVPNLGHSGPVTPTTTAKYAEGLYGSGAQTYVQGYEKATGRLFYNNNGRCVTGLSELAHLGESRVTYTAAGTANTAGQWADHALNEMRAGQGDRVAKYLERLERDLAKSYSMTGMPTNAAIQEELLGFRKELKSTSELLKKSPWKLNDIANKVTRLVTRGKAEAAIVSGFENAGPLRRAYLRVMFDGVAAKNKLGELIGKVMEKAPPGVDAESTMNFIVFCIGTKAAAESAGRGDDPIEALSNISGAVNPLKIIGPLKLIGPALLAEIMAEVMIEARANGFEMAASFQGAWDLMEGIYSAWGRADVDPDPRRKLTLADLLTNFQDESKLEAIVMAQAIRAATRGLGTANEQHDDGVARSIFAKCWPTIRDAWRWERDLLTTEYLQLGSEVVHTPLLIYYAPQEPRAGQKITCEARSADGKLGDRLGRMRQIVRSLYGKGSGLAVNYYWSPGGAPVGERDWQHGYTFPKPGLYPVKVRMEVTPFTRMTKTEPRVMLTRVVPALVDIVVGGEAKPPVTASGGCWVLANKTIEDKVKPNFDDRTSGGVRYTGKGTASVTATSASCSQTYVQERPVPPKPSPNDPPRLLTKTFVRNAKWTLPPERLAIGEKITIDISLDSKGSKVVTDPPGARGSSDDVSSEGSVSQAVILRASPERSGGGNPPIPQTLLVMKVTPAEGQKQGVWEVPASDAARGLLQVTVSFRTGYGADGSYTAVYDYRFQPGARK